MTRAAARTRPPTTKTELASNGAHRNGHARTASPPAGPADVSVATIDLALGRRALVNAGRLPVSASAATPRLRFRVSRTETCWSVAAALHDPATGTDRDLAGPGSIRWLHDAASDLWHIESADLRATIDRTAAAPRLLFAATPLLAALGLSGGRYETAGVTLD